MNLLEVIFVSIGLTLDVYAVMVCKGAMFSRIRKSQLIISSAIFGAWQLMALLLGNLITAIPLFKDDSRIFSVIGQGISAIIFFAIGIYMLWKAWRNETIFEHREDRINFKEICLLAVITGFDAFFAGIGFAFLETKVLMEAFIILVVTIILVILGTFTGYRLGYEQKSKAYMIGGTILILAGLDVIIRYVEIF